MTTPIYFYKTDSLSNLKPNSLVALKLTGGLDFSLWVTDKTGIPYPLKDNTGGGGGTIEAIINTDGNLTITGTTTKTINVSSSLLLLINSALQAGDNISELVNDANYITLADIPAFVASDYDLEDFTNAGADPYAHLSDLSTGITNLDYIPSPTQGIVTSDTGTNATIPLADGTNAGLLSSAEKAEIATALQPSDITGLVPYTGATTDVDLGEYQLKAGQLELDQTPTGTFSTAKIRWNDTAGTAEMRLKGDNVTLQIGQELVKRVVNKTATNITLQESNYQVVRIIGATGQRLSVDLAQADSEANSASTLGLVTENIANNQEGFITFSGEINLINTTGSLQGETWVDGDVLYLSPTIAGQLTNIEPIAPDRKIRVGYVQHTHATQGKIHVDVDRGYSLENLHNVKITTTTVGKILGSTTEGLWENKTIPDALGFTPENIANKSDSYTTSSSTAYVSGKALVEGLGTKQNTLTNPVTGTGVGGQVSFWDGTNTQTGGNRLLWDNTNSSLEVNGNAPRFTLKNNLNNFSTYFTNNAGGGLALKNHQDKTLAFFTNPVGSTDQPQMAIGNVTSIPTESQLYVYGGINGANIDARGSATVDECNIDLEGNDWTTSPNSLGFSYFGSKATSSGTMLGYPKNKLGIIRFQETNYAIINSEKVAGVSPIRFGINNIEIGNVNDKGFSYQSDFSSVNSSNPRWLADKGYVDTKAPLSGSENYIQNQNAAAQSANMWISGSIKAKNIQTLDDVGGFYTYGRYSSGQPYSLNILSDAAQGFKFTNSSAIPLLTIESSGAALFTSTVTASSFNGSATLTGTPTAPTATAGTNTTQIATTAFVAGGLATKENSFTKNTAFNKNFGTTAGTVVEGGTLGSNAYNSTVIPTNTNQLTNGAGYITDISGKEDIANKQNSLAVDGSNTKYPTVTAVNTGLGLKENILNNPITGVGSQNNANTYALQDGTILYHSVKWFIPTSTVSTNGTTVTSVDTQFTSAMVGAKLTINGEWRIITAFTSTTVVTVASAYSQNYSGVVAGSWGCYSRCSSITSTGNVYYYSYQGVVMFVYISSDQFNVRFSGFSMTDNGVAIQSGGALLRDSAKIFWSNNATYYGTKDLGLRRNSAGVLEIYDGITPTGLEANRRDLLARNLFGSKVLIGSIVDDNVNQGQYTGTVSSGTTTLGNTPPTANNQLTRKDYVDTGLVLKAPLASPSLTGTPTAPTATAGANTTQIATTAFVTGADSQNVKLTGNQTISGQKSFSLTGKIDMQTNNAFPAISVTSLGSNGESAVVFTNDSSSPYSSALRLQTGLSGGVGNMALNVLNASPIGTGIFSNASNGGVSISSESHNGDSYISNISYGGTGRNYVGRNNGTETYSVDKTGNVTATQYKISALNTAPASATATGTTGEIRITSGFIYICIATNTWVRAALTTWI